MSGSRSNYGLAQQGMLPYGEWLHPESGRPTTAFYAFMQTLWRNSGGSATPVNPDTGASGVAALAEDVAGLETEVAGLQGLAFGLGEIADVVEAPTVDYSFAHWDSIPDTPASQAKSASISFKAGGLLAGDTFFTAQSSCKVVGVRARLNSANVGAATLTPARVPSGTAVSVGTAISAALDLTGTVNTSQSLTLTSTVLMVAGDSLGLLGSGVIVAATGSLTVFYVEL